MSTLNHARQQELAIFTFPRRKCHVRRDNLSRPRRTAFHPDLETLQERVVLSVSSAAVNAASVFYISNTGKLYYDHVVVDLTGHSQDHWVHLQEDAGVAQVSIGTNALAGNPTTTETAFILLTDGTLREFSKGFTYNLYYRTVKQISASQTTADTVYVLFQNGQLFRHTGLSQANQANPSTGWTYITDNVNKVQATQASVHEEAVVVLYNTGSVKEFIFPPNQKTVVNTWATPRVITDISAAPLATGGSVFYLDGAHNLYHHQGLDSKHDTSLYVAVNVAQMSAGDAYVQGLVYVLGTNKSLYELYEGASQEYVKPLTPWGVNVVSFSAVMPLGVTYKDGAFTLDNVFVQQANGRLWEITGNQTYRYSKIAFVPHTLITVHTPEGDVTEKPAPKTVNRRDVNDRYVYTGDKPENAPTAVELTRVTGVDY